MRGLVAMTACALLAATWAAPVDAASEGSVEACPLAPAESRSPTTELGLAALRLAEGRASEAARHYAVEVERARRAGDAPRLAFGLAGVLRARIEAGDPIDVVASATELAALLSRLDDARLSARLRLHMVQSLLLGLEAGAVAVGDIGPRIEAELAALEASLSGSGGAMQASVAGHRAEWILAQGGDASEAMGQARLAALRAQQAGSDAATARWLTELARIQRATGDVDAALATLRAAVDRLEAARQRPAHSDASVRLAARRREAATYALLVDLLLARAETSEPEEQQTILRNTRRYLEARKAAELRDYFRDPCLDAHRRAEPDEIPGTLVVYPVLLPDRVELIASRDGRFWRHRVGVTGAELDALVRRFRVNLESAMTRRYVREAAELHALLIEPLRPLIDEPKTRSLVLVAEGSLRTIPIGALRDGIDGPFLIERIPVSVTASLTLTNPGETDPARARLLRVGISQSVGGFDALPAVREELDEIGRTFEGEELIDERFRLRTFREALQRRPYGIVHIASHGEFLPDSRESFLLAWQERITMDDLADAIGSTQFRGRGVELLTLSACQTTAGDDRAALGLAGIAVKSGARSALATLWSINDEAAAALIARFYTELAKPDVSRAEALRRAQLAVRAESRWKHPAYWAAFMLIGNWT